MKVLLDENLAHALRHHIPNHDIETASYAGLAGYKNGALLKAASAAGFNVLVTGDKTLQYEQNIEGQKLAIISLSAIAWRIIKNHTVKIADAVDAALPGTVVRVECGSFKMAELKGPTLG